MRTARAGAQEFRDETRPRKDSAVDPVAHSQEDEADAILFSVAGVGGLPAYGDGFAYQDRYTESEAEAEPYWATWSLV
jgi:hypothetical protein